jgi:sulfonate transport system substrate-binding protein
MRLLLFWLLALAALTAPGCARPAEDGSRLRVAYLPRLTHAPAMTALESGRLGAALPGVRVEAHAFEVGNSIVEALFAGEVDVAYLGPNPAINGFVRSGGAVRLLAGVATGGSALLVREGVRVTRPEDLRHKKLATPEIASTQDIALRRYLRRHGLGDDVTVLPMSAAEIRIALERGEIDGAWVSEPLASELVLARAARVWLDEADEWPDHRYPTTVLAVRTRFAEAHPDIVRRVLGVHDAELRFIESHRAEALELTLGSIAKTLGRRPPEPVALRAWAGVRFSGELRHAWLERLAADAEREGFLPPAPLGGLELEVPADGEPLARKEPAP